MDHILWVEKYRPKTVQDCILPERLKTPFLKYVELREIPNLLISGTAGVGKTTVAKALCEDVGCDYLVINGSDENGVDTVRYKIKNYASSMSLVGGRKVIIVDEADYLTPNAQAAFRNAMEEFSSNCSFIFTCNYKSRIIQPLHSRCAAIDFTLRGKEKAQAAGSFYKLVQDILTQNGVEYDEKVLAEIVKKFFPDFRRTINELQRYSKFGKIVTSSLAQMVDFSVEVVLGLIKAKDFSGLRKWVATNEVDNTMMFRKVYDSLYDVLKPHSIPQAVLIIDDYQVRQPDAADSEIHLLAFFTRLMVDCEFK